MGKLESKFQKELTDKIKQQYPGCLVMKNDSGYIQGIPDWTILYKNKWAMLEAKKSKNANVQPNQEYYVERVNSMAFARIVYPENEEQVLTELHDYFAD